MILITLITVNYNHSNLTLDLMHSLNALNEEGFELIIVDNGSKVPFNTDIEVGFPYRVIHTGSNLGFAGGNEVGMKLAKGEYLYLINNDTEIHMPFVDPIVSTFKKYPNLGMLSTLIRFYDTRLLQYAGATNLSSITLRNEGIGSGAKDSSPYKGYRETGFIHGASVVVPKQVYERVGGMWEPFFLYYEEYDWCARIKQAGYNVGVLGDVEILHKESASVGRMSPLKIKYMTRNRILFARRNVKLFWPITVVYLVFIVGVRDVIRYVVTGQFELVLPLLKGILLGLTTRTSV